MLNRLVSYNAWANESILSFFDGHEREILDRDTGGSFSSINKLLLHIWDAQVIWLRRLHGASPDHFPSQDFNGTFTDVRAGIMETSTNYVEFVSGLPATAYDKPIRYSTTIGAAFENSAREIVTHVMMHSMYHRGQAIVYARQFDLREPPSTDYIRYLREQQNVWD